MNLSEYAQERGEKSPAFAQAVADRKRRAELLRSIGRRRSELGISQADVAKRMDTTQSAVSDLETGGTDPRLSTVQRFASALDCHLVFYMVRNGLPDGPVEYPSHSNIATVTKASWLSAPTELAPKFEFA